MSGADVEVYLSQVHDGSVSSGFRALYEERLLLDVTLLIEEHHFQVQEEKTRRLSLSIGKMFGTKYLMFFCCFYVACFMFFRPTKLFWPLRATTSGSCLQQT